MFAAVLRSPIVSGLKGNLVKARAVPATVILILAQAEYILFRVHCPDKNRGEKANKIRRARRPATLHNISVLRVKSDCDSFDV
jgi:hypothetical protein